MTGITKFVLLFCLQCFTVNVVSELISNGDFESEIDETNWFCNGCTLERDPNAYGGKYSGRVTDRYSTINSTKQHKQPINKKEFQ